jgi:cytoskeletal protein CcmA (bactofilin family)
MIRMKETVMFGVKGEEGDEGQVSGLLERGCEFEGKLTFRGTVRVNGRFSGEIFSDGVLIIGEGAEVHARVEAGSVIINGVVRGQIIAQDRIEMNNPAQVQGDIQARTLVIEEGVVFEGNCRMGESVAETIPTVEMGHNGASVHVEKSEELIAENAAY